MHSLNPDHNNCLHDLAETYVLRRLKAMELDEFEEHLLICMDCQDRVRESEAFIQSLRAAFSAETHTHRALMRPRALRVARSRTAHAQS